MSRFKVQWFVRWDPSGNTWRFSSELFDRRKDAKLRLDRVTEGHHWQLCRIESTEWTTNTNEVIVLEQGKKEVQER